MYNGLEISNESKMIFIRNSTEGGHHEINNIFEFKISIQLPEEVAVLMIGPPSKTSPMFKDCSKGFCSSSSKSSWIY